MHIRRLTLSIASVLATIVVAGGLILADPASPVTVSIVDSPDPVASGTQLLYTVTVVNTAGSKLTNMVLSNQVNGVAGIGVPPQLQLSSTRGSCNQSGNLVTCNAGTVEGGGTWVVTIRGVVTAASGTVINETATVSGTRSAQNFTTTSTATTLVSGGGGSLADLTIGKAGPTSVVASSPLTYTLTINNSGAANATGVKVVDTLPAGVTGITATGTSLFVCNVVGQTVTCTGGAVNQGSNATVTINGTAPSTPGAITNTAVVDPDNTIPESNELNNTSALVNTLVTSSQTAPVLTIDQTDASPAIPGNPAWAQGAGPDPVNPGQTLTYKVHVVNTASSRADDVRVVDGTQGLVAATVTASQAIVNGSVGNFGGCTVAASQIACSIKSLNAGGTMDVTITGQVITSAGSTIFNTATVTGNISNKGVTATDSEITTVRPAIDLTITKADAPDPVCAASWPGPGGVCQGGLTYTFVVGNSGTQVATGVVVRDPLPPGMIYVPSKTTAPNFSGGCSVDAGNVVTCTGGTVNPQSITPISINVVVPPGLGTITNTVTVDPNNAIFEADETNNTFTQLTTVATGIDLTVAKHSNHEANFVATRGTLTYTITVSNLGTQDSTNISVRDTLPADTIFRDAVADASHGFSCSQSNGVVDCVGGRLQGTASMNYPNLAGTLVDVATITVRILATAYEQPAMHNEVRVDPLNRISEANELNNLATQDTKVQHGGATNDSFNQLTISKIQKSPDPTNTARNAVVTYEIKVGNDGTDPAVGVKVRDTLPAGTRYIQATGTNSFLCTQAVAGVVDCVGGQIPDHTPTASGATITLTAFAPDTPDTYTNQVEVDPDHAIAEGNEFDNNASAQTVVKNGGTGSFNDLTVSFQPAPVSTASTTPGGTITYRLDVTNLGTNAALNVAVRDILPTGVTFVSAADAASGAGAFTCTQSGGVIDCTGATIAGTVPGPAGTRTIIITVTAPNHVGPLLDQAIADPNNAIPEGDETNNTATFPTSVDSQINLSVTKTGPPSSNQSQTSEYDITVANTPPSGGAGQTAFGVVMHDPLPVGLIPLSVQFEYKPGPGNWACQIQGDPINLVDCLGDLNPGQSVTIKVGVFMTAESGKPLDNQACVDPDHLIEQYSPPGRSDDCSTHTTIVAGTKRSPNLFVTKNGDPTQVTSGNTLTYTIGVQNNGDADAFSPVTLTDVLPSQVTFVDANGTNGWTCTGTTTVTCHDDGSGLAVGASATVTIHTTVNSGVTVPIVNTAKAAPATHNPAESDAEDETFAHQADNTATTKSSTGGSAFDLVLSSITDNPDPVIPGQGLKYTIVAVNGGSAAANGVHLAITLPSATSVTFLSADGSNGFNCSGPVANALDCVGDLPAGGDTTVTVSMIVMVQPIPAPDLVLSAEIDSAHAFAESDEGNNVKTETTTISGLTCSSCIDLVAAQLVPSADPMSSGGSETFTFQVVNVGDTSTATNPLTDTLIEFDYAAEVSLTPGVPVSSNPAITCTATPFGSPVNGAAIKCVGNLGPGQGVTITVPITNVVGNLFAIGTADPGGKVSESNEGNNVLTQSVVVF